MTDVDCCKSTYRNYTSEMFWKLWKMKCSGNHCSFCVDWNSWTWIQCQFNAEWSQTKWQIPDDQSNVTQNWEAKIAVIGFASVLLCRQHHCASNSCRYNHQRPHKQKNLMPSCWVPFRLFWSLLPAPACVLLQLKTAGVLPLPASLSLYMYGHMVFPTNGVMYFVGWVLKH